MRGEAEGTDHGDESGDRRSPLRRKHGVSRWSEPQEKSHRRLPARAPRCVQQVLDRPGTADRPLHGAAVLR